MRVRWAYADSSVPGLMQHIKSSLGNDLDKFQLAREKFGENIFLNSFVSTLNKPLSPAMMLSQELEIAASTLGVSAPEVSISDFSNWDGTVTTQDVITVTPMSLKQVAVVVKAINALKEKQKDGNGPRK